jgi:alcohol dehydrogenase YqhD (iron-dependent ADH family)
MHAFEFYSPTHIYFGSGAEEQVGSHIARLGGHRVLVVCGRGSAVKSGLLDRVSSSLRQAGLSFQTLQGVQPNPRLSLVQTGVDQALEFGADFLLAVGGGSVIDTAKAIADGAASPGVDLWALWTKRLPLQASLPVGVVLTIPAAGSESSESAVLTNDQTKEKRGLSSDLHRPKFAILNPDLTLTLPPYQVACGVVDILMHTMDRYFNPVQDNLLTDALAQALLRTVIRCGRQALEQPGHREAMSELMWAGSLSHNGLTGLGGQKDFAPHQLGHELSAMFDVAHGASLSAVWGSWAQYCLPTSPERFAQFATQVWDLPSGPDAQTLGQQGISATVDYFRSLGMPTSLPELGLGVLPQKTLAELAHRCSFYGQRTVGSLRVLQEPDLLAIYQAANHS